MFFYLTAIFRTAHNEENSCDHFFSPLGLFLGRSRLLLSQQIVFWHWAPPGWPVQERSHPLLIAQWRPEEGDLELHPLCVRNTVRLPLRAETIKIKNTRDVQKPAFLCVCSIVKVVFAFGRSYDDYDYGEVNQLLERDLKLYVKAVACFPDSTKTPVCPLRWTPLKTSERVRLFFSCYEESCHVCKQRMTLEVRAAIFNLAQMQQNKDLAGSAELSLLNWGHYQLKLNQETLKSGGKRTALTRATLIKVYTWSKELKKKAT